MKGKFLFKLVTCVAILSFTNLIVACKSVKIPEGVQVVENFDINSYSGTWYEIARFDFKHEKNLDKVTAEYSVSADGSLKVVNTGFDTLKQEWKQSVGKAKFLEDSSKGALKVSFFGPFYSGYNIVAMDPDYKNALIFGENTDYIWFLSRKKVMSDEVKNQFLRLAKDAGYDLKRLVWTRQN